jgi:hypothetical protein
MPTPCQHIAHLFARFNGHMILFLKKVHRRKRRLYNRKLVERKNGSASLLQESGTRRFIIRD